MVFSSLTSQRHRGAPCAPRECLPRASLSDDAIACAPYFSAIDVDCLPSDVAL